MSRRPQLVTVVSGTTFTGLYAADGSLNVIESPGTSPVGRYHPCGALYVTVSPGSGPLGRMAPDGSIYVTNSSTEFSGALYVSVVSGSLFTQAETDLILASFVTPATSGRATIIDTAVEALKTNSLWDSIYLLYVSAAEVEQQGLINWKNPGTNTLTKAGTVGFTADRGFLATGATADGLQTGYPVTGLDPQNLAISIWFNNTAVAGNRYDFGNGGSNAYWRARVAGDTGGSRLGNSANVVGPTVITDTIGLHSMIRTTDLIKFYKDGIPEANTPSTAVTSQALSAGNFNFLNSNIGTTSSTLRQGALFAITTARNDAQEAIWQSIWNDYMTSVGNV